tara:strand:+ start:181 stop:672 length:492 start_codon:yes stop_codon:yes gene_type:complete
MSISEIKIDIESESSSEDKERIEQPWDTKSEQFIQDLKLSCDQISKMFNLSSRKAKKKYNLLAIPTIILPLICSIIIPKIEKNKDIINSVLLCMIGILNGLSTFFNFGKKMIIFNEYSGKYTELSNIISLELAKPKKYRIDLDVFLERVTLKKQQLDSSAPYI